VRQLGQVRVNFGFQRGRRHPPRTFTNYLVKPRDVLASRPLFGDCSQHGRAFPTDAATSALLDIYTNRSPRTYARLCQLELAPA